MKSSLVLYKLCTESADKGYRVENDHTGHVQTKSSSTVAVQEYHILPRGKD